MSTESAAQSPQLSIEDWRAWKDLCDREYAAFKAANAVPMPMSFWSGSAWFNAGEDWGRLWDQRTVKLAESFFGPRGLEVNWQASYRGPLKLVPKGSVPPRRVRWN